MGKRGRKSAAELTVVGSEAAQKEIALVIERPEAPPELTAEQEAIWDEIVDGLAAGYFTTEMFPLLTQYCRHVTRARRYAQLLENMEKKKKFDEKDIKAYRDLSRSEEEQTRAIASLATKMRLSQQSTYDRKRAKDRNDDDLPWNFGK